MGDCGQLHTDFDPIAAAPAQSAFIAVLAGFVFIGVVYILTEGRRRYSGGTLVLFMASFLCLAAGSYMGSLISGEVPCRRAWSESMFVSGFMAVGIVAMLCGVVWLLPDYHGTHRYTRSFMIVSVVFIAFVAIELMTTNARAYVLDQNISQTWRDNATWFLGAAPGIIVAFFLRHLPRSPVGRLRERQQGRATIAAFTILAYVLCSLVILGLVGDRPAPLWKAPASWVVDATIFVPDVGAAIAVMVVIWSLPTAKSWAEPSESASPVPVVDPR